MAQTWFWTLGLLTLVFLALAIWLATKEPTDKNFKIFSVFILCIAVCFVAFTIVGHLNHTLVTDVEYRTTKDGTVFIFNKETLFSQRVDIYKNPSMVRVTKNLFGVPSLNLP